MKKKEVVLVSTVIATLIAIGCHARNLQGTEQLANASVAKSIEKTALLCVKEAYPGSLIRKKICRHVEKDVLAEFQRIEKPEVEPLVTSTFVEDGLICVKEATPGSLIRKKFCQKG